MTIDHLGSADFLKTVEVVFLSPLTGLQRQHRCFRHAGKITRPRGLLAPPYLTAAIWACLLPFLLKHAPSFQLPQRLSLQLSTPRASQDHYLPQASPPAARPGTIRVPPPSPRLSAVAIVMKSKSQLVSWAPRLSVCVSSRIRVPQLRFTPPE